MKIDSETLYKKVGRRYVPVAELSRSKVDSFPSGTHLVTCKPGHTLTSYNVQPHLAPMLAAASHCRESISNVIMKATDLRLPTSLSKEMTEEQSQAWNHLVTVFDGRAKQLEWPSAWEASEAAIKALAKETEELLTNETVRLAYEHFLTMCALSYDKK